ncbi:MAG: MerR family transcriptional regulator [Cutibacterium granulosum]|nr:MAG: MerR family transcriptional regulator [Cutibacterium granulosum]
MVEKVRTIGQVMRLLTPEYPDLSISKIRYLESEGLLSPERAPSGYRKYSEDDIQRLRYILTCQRDRFLPLKVIRENLEQLTRRQLIRASGITEAFLLELERHQLVRPKRGQSWYGQEALVVCVAARRLSAYGMDSRHLRAVRQAAEQEAGLIEQSLIPLARQPKKSSKAASEVTQLMMHAHTAMVYDLLEYWSAQ